MSGVWGLGCVFVHWVRYGFLYRIYGMLLEVYGIYVQGSSSVPTYLCLPFQFQFVYVCGCNGPSDVESVCFFSLTGLWPLNPKTAVDEPMAAQVVRVPNLRRQLHKNIKSIPPIYTIQGHLGYL